MMQMKRQRKAVSVQLPPCQLAVTSVSLHVSQPLLQQASMSVSCHFSWPPCLLVVTSVGLHVSYPLLQSASMPVGCHFSWPPCQLAVTSVNFHVCQSLLGWPSSQLAVTWLASMSVSRYLVRLPVSYPFFGWPPCQLAVTSVRLHVSQQLLPLDYMSVSRYFSYLSFLLASI